MIKKSYEIKSCYKDYNFYLFYGKNNGAKKEEIKNFISLNKNKNVYKYEEKYIFENEENFLINIFSGSLFENEKIIIINQGTDKIVKIIEQLFNKNNLNILIIINADNLEKKSKLRNLFEKEKELVCIPFYEDNDKSLSLIAQNFLRDKKIKCSNEIINLLVGRSSGDRGNLINELNKIENLSITKKNIDIEDVLKLTNLSENYSVFELAENYLAKNKNQISKILNENNFANEECILILRTILNRSKRLLKLKESQNVTGNIDLTISSFKPPIFWKEKDALKKQIQLWSNEEVKKIIYKINDLEILIKRNSSNSLNFISDFVSNY